MATFKSKMKYLDPDWADRIWEGASAVSNGKGAAWRLAIAALALTGARPASLERGIAFTWIRDSQGVLYLTAKIPGAKLLKNHDGTARRGQEFVQMAWRVSRPTEAPPREREFLALVDALSTEDPTGKTGSTITVSYNKDAIATAVRDLSKQLWPRRTRHVSPICYREMFSATAKASGMAPDALAAAMGHISAESQGKYHAYRGKAKGKVSPKSLFSQVKVPTKIKMERAPMARFKAAAANAKRAKMAKP